MAGQPETWDFPTSQADFDKDDRISFSRPDSKYIAVHDDGTEYEFDPVSRLWIPIIDEALMEEQQRGYFTTNNNPDEDEAGGPSKGKKRKNGHSHDREQKNASHSNNKKKQARGGTGAAAPENRAVYVTGLPLDATVDEVVDLFSRKCGVIAEELESGRPRVKLYTDAATGRFKGDALVVFFKPQSVDMAIMLLDDTDFRLGSASDTKMRVQAADASYKKTSTAATAAPNGGSGGGGGEATTTTTTSGKAGKADKAKAIKKAQKLSAKLADWDEDENDALAALHPNLAPKGTKWDKVVILRHMFTLAELDEDPVAMLEIKEDIRDECAKLGPVTNVVLYDAEEEGIVSVRFKTAEAAEACLQLMHGRAFDGRTVEAFYATGKEKFRKSKRDEDEHMSGAE